MYTEMKEMLVQGTQNQVRHSDIKYKLHDALKFTLSEEHFKKVERNKLVEIFDEMDQKGRFDDFIQRNALINVK